MSSPVPPGSPAAAQAPAQAKTKTLGDYELVGKLGAGAMGAVYLAKQKSTGRDVALKLLPPDMAKDAEFLERFRREARSAMRIHHPNIVAAYDIGVAEGHNYIAMEYVDGPNLEVIFQKKGRFDEKMLMKLLLDMSGALEAAQHDGIVHRDIKPANILLNSQGVAKLTDLGLASAAQGDQRVTLAGYAVGTPYYISPEQARGDSEVDIRADIYGLGATVYHLATGHLPFAGANPIVIMTKHLQEKPVPPHEKEPSVPKSISALIMKMMAKDPRERQQTPGELREDIQRLQRGEMPLPPGKYLQSKMNPTTIEMKAFPEVVAAAKQQQTSSDPLQAFFDSILFFLPAGLRVPAGALLVSALLLGVVWLIFALR